MQAWGKHYTFKKVCFKKKQFVIAGIYGYTSISQEINTGEPLNYPQEAEQRYFSVNQWQSVRNELTQNKHLLLA